MSRPDLIVTIDYTYLRDLSAKIPTSERPGDLPHHVKMIAARSNDLTDSGRMKMSNDVDAYIEKQPSPLRENCQRLRDIIRWSKGAYSEAGINL